MPILQQNNPIVGAQGIAPFLIRRTSCMLDVSGQAETPILRDTPRLIRPTSNIIVKYL
jgi:hypothetical protein